MHGLHLTADLSGCAAAGGLLTDVRALRGLCLAAVRQAGLSPVADCFHPFPAQAGAAGGATGVVLLAESHLAVHTWPELAAVTLDVYVCNVGSDNSGAARALMEALVAAFAPAAALRHAIDRGALPLPDAVPAGGPRGA